MNPAIFDILTPSVSTTNPKSYPHVLSGSVKVEGQLQPLRVRVYNRNTASLIATKWAKADGTFEFRSIPKLPEKSLMVIALESTGSTHNAQVFDFVTAYNPNAPTT